MVEQRTASYTLRAVLLLILLIILAYSNTFQASWHFDDYSNLVQCDDIRVNNLFPGTLHKKYSELQNGNHRQRPVTWFTFVVNWYFGRDNVAGYHAVNLVIHIVSSVLLLLCCRNILVVYVFFKTDDHRLALLSAFLAAAMWALHPIQTQAVTYVVQRMASLSGMFYIAAVYFFLRGLYLKNRGFVKFVPFVLMGLCFILALGSKPSAAMFPVAVGFFYVLFAMPKPHSISLIARVAVLGVVIVAVGSSAWYFIGNNPLSLFAGYSIRPFTLTERLLTEGRILVFHLMQLFLLKPFSFSLVHDISISSSLISPFSTLLSFLFIVLLIAFSWCLRKREPILSFAIGFFFINHVVESTILPLELIYEHRNYIPSMFLFLPLSTGFVKYIYSCNRNSQYYSWGSLFPSIVLLLLMGLTIYRNKDWRNEKTFWSDAIRKAPGIARPYHNLARDHYERIGDYKTALELYQTALTKRDLRPDHKSYSYNNIASLYFRMGEHDTALEYTERALQMNPEYETAIYNKCLILISTGRLVEAEEIVAWLAEKNTKVPEYRTLYGFTLMKLGKYTDATHHLQTVVEENPLYMTGMMHYGVLQSTLGQYVKAEKTLVKLCQYEPSNLIYNLCLLDLYVRIGSGIANKYVTFLLNRYELVDLLKMVDTAKNDLLAPLLEYTDIESVLNLER